MPDLSIGDPNPSRKPRAKPDSEFKPGTWGLTSTSNNDTARVSTCGVCNVGVYKNQARVWCNGFDGPIGINHQACVQP